MASQGKLQLDNIQGDILLNGLPKKAEIFLFFEITDPKTFCSKLKQVADEIAHSAHTSSSRDKIGKKNGAGIVEMAGANIAFSFRGLQKVSPQRHVSGRHIPHTKSRWPACWPA